jgi:flagellar biosynthesis/type III secretory pathway protein FliH
MFDQVYAYSGSVTRTSENSEILGGEFSEINIPQMPQEALEAAQVRAQEIIAEAEASAEEIIIDSRKKAVEEAEAIIALTLTKASAALRVDLLEAEHGLTTIVEDAIHSMLGKIGEDQAIYLAVKQAITKYCDDRSVTIRAEKSTMERLQLVALGEGKRFGQLGATLKVDATVSRGRCILDTGDANYDISLGSQLDALSKALKSIA